MGKAMNDADKLVALPKGSLSWLERARGKTRKLHQAEVNC